MVGSEKVCTFNQKNVKWEISYILWHWVGVYVWGNVNYIPITRKTLIHHQTKRDSIINYLVSHVFSEFGWMRLMLLTRQLRESTESYFDYWKKIKKFTLSIAYSINEFHCFNWLDFLNKWWIQNGLHFLLISCKSWWKSKILLVFDWQRTNTYH
jgi:hypothetical protein